MFRKIYEVDVITEDGELVGRYFACNKKAAAGIIRRQATAKNRIAYLHEVCKTEWTWIDENEVQR